MGLKKYGPDEIDLRNRRNPHSTRNGLGWVIGGALALAAGIAAVMKGEGEIHAKQAWDDRDADWIAQDLNDEYLAKKNGDKEPKDTEESP